MDQENDARPEHSYASIPQPARPYASDSGGSPYASEIIAMRFQSGPALNIPRDLLRQSPLLVARLEVDDHSFRPSKEIRLPDITYIVGHVIVHFLVTGAYQCLKPQGDSTPERHVAEFTTTLRVYAASDSLKLTSLRDMARSEITRVGEKLSLPSMMSVMERSQENFSQYPGISAYIEYRMLAFVESATLEMTGEVLAELRTPNTLSKILLRSMVLMKSSELARRYEMPSEDDLQECQSDRDYPLDGHTVSSPDRAMKEAEEVAKAQSLRRTEEARVVSERAELTNLRAKKAARGKPSKREKKRLAYLIEQEERRAKSQGDEEAGVAGADAQNITLFDTPEDDSICKEFGFSKRRMRQKRGRLARDKNKQPGQKSLEDNIARKTAVRIAREEETSAIQEGIKEASDEESFLFPSPQTSTATIGLGETSLRSESSGTCTLDIASIEEYEEELLELESDDLKPPDKTFSHGREVAASSCPDAETHLAPRSSGWLFCEECTSVRLGLNVNGIRARGRGRGRH
ncbi:hypothetical protein N0V84_005316 [Fusarium piperis]|uniref:Uncharacterized protein n=1 Tax=Fusarium piperis TaxID=1435070 RepID=A0A9W8WE77_9HYPO|nr:hypothetical protein N0V84_005316 [Fusarium piperis]